MEYREYIKCSRRLVKLMHNSLCKGRCKAMEWIGLICLVVIVFYSSYPKKVRTLEKKMKKLETKCRGEIEMSKLISELVGKKCKIDMESGFLDVCNSETLYDVLDTDDEWIKVSYEDKKKGHIVKIVRIDDIESIEQAGKL